MAVSLTKSTKKAAATTAPWGSSASQPLAIDRRHMPSSYGRDDPSTHARGPALKRGTRSSAPSSLSGIVPESVASGGEIWDAAPKRCLHASDMRRTGVRGPFRTAVGVAESHLLTTLETYYNQSTKVNKKRTKSPAKFAGQLAASCPCCGVLPARSRSIRKSPSRLSLTRSISLTILRTMASSSTCSLTNHCIKVWVA